MIFIQFSFNLCRLNAFGFVQLKFHSEIYYVSWKFSTELLTEFFPNSNTIRNFCRWLHWNAMQKIKKSFSRDFFSLSLALSLPLSLFLLNCMPLVDADAKHDINNCESRCFQAKKTRMGPFNIYSHWDWFLSCTAHLNCNKFQFFVNAIRFMQFFRGCCCFCYS